MFFMILTVDSLVKCFAGVDRPVLNGVSLSLAPGETVALTGESGSGKSTLLHCVAGLEPFDSGDVHIGGNRLSAMNDAARAKMRRHAIGIIFQQFNLIPSLSVAQNIAFQARLANQSPDDHAIDTLAENLGLADQLGKYPEELSGGQQQRVAIARAILPKPKLVLADEPTGNLDETTATEVFDALVSQCRSTGSGLLLVTHSERLAALTDRRLHLSHGELQ